MGDKPNTAKTCCGREWKGWWPCSFCPDAIGPAGPLRLLEPENDPASPAASEAEAMEPSPAAVKAAGDPSPL